MKTITLRDIPPVVAEKIRLEAERSGASLNKTVLDLLSHAVNSEQKSRRVYHDLDHLAGSWSQDEADALDESLLLQRSIDEDMWK